jgi:hypothetical protein
VIPYNLLMLLIVYASVWSAVFLAVCGIGETWILKGEA